MDRIFRNVLTYALIFVVLIGVISLFKGQNEPSEEMNVKEFMSALEGDKISEMTMQPKNKIIRITGELKKDDKPFVVQVPDNNDIIANITDTANEKSVLKIEQEEQPSAFVSFLTNALGCSSCSIFSTLFSFAVSVIF